MRIERHRVSERALRGATENFADRVWCGVRFQRHCGREGFGWETICGDLRAYAGARSVETPETDADIRAALYSAAEARVGALKIQGAPANAEFSVHIGYTGTGVFYREYRGPSGFEPHEQRPVPLRDWTEALYLCVISDLHDDNKGTFDQFASSLDDGDVLHRALIFYLFPEPGGERNELLGHIEHALVNFFASLGREERRPGLSSVDSDLLFLHALLSRDEQAFWMTMAARLSWFRDNEHESSPTSLLPVAELAFAALAVRVEGWEMPFETDYLPRRLVAGSAPGGG